MLEGLTKEDAITLVNFLGWKFYEFNNSITINEPNGFYTEEGEPSDTGIPYYNMVTTKPLFFNPIFDNHQFVQILYLVSRKFPIEFFDKVSASHLEYENNDIRIWKKNILQTIIFSLTKMETDNAI